MTFVIISAIVAILIAILMPKRLTKIEMFSTCLFALLLQKQVDIFLALKYHLYGYEGKIRFINVFINTGLFSAANIIILNYFPKRLKSKLFFILEWSVGLTIFEWAAVKSGYFHHTGWKYRYSFLCNLVIVPILYWCLLFVRKLIYVEYSVSLNEQRKDRLIKNTFTKPRALFVGYVNKIYVKRKARD